MSKSRTNRVRAMVDTVIETGKDSVMSTKELADRLADTVPPEHRERFLSELREHLLNTFLHANVAVGGSLAFAGGFAVEKGVEAAAGATGGVWGLGWLHRLIQSASDSPVVENLPEALCFLTVVVSATGNYRAYRRSQRELRGEMTRFACGFLAKHDGNGTPA